MIGGSTPCIPQTLGILSPSTSSSSCYLQPSSSSDTHSNSLLYNLSLLKEKFRQLQSVVSFLISTTNPSQQPTESTAIAIANIDTLVQDIIVASSSMLLTCQQITQTNTTADSQNQHNMNHLHNQGVKPGFWASDDFDWSNHNNHLTNSRHNISGSKELTEKVNMDQVVDLQDKGCDIVEMDVADLLAKYTHYCQVCGKGFKRDANLRMHMRAHGDEYKSSAALINPMKRNVSIGSSTSVSVANEGVVVEPRKYSCPQDGCRWNRNHEKFQPLKSVICVKNHYKRSHCPKMYICKRCNSKQFSVLSDLKTHEKHCGDVKWRCSCGTTFSRKDKLVGHVSLFAGHVPVTNTTTTTAKKGNIGAQRIM